MSRDVAVFLRQMLANATLNVGSDDFPQVATLATQALTELDQIIGADNG